MDKIGRGSDGRRLFTTEFKRTHIGRVERGEVTIAELSRDLDISRTVLQRRRRLLTTGGDAAIKANGAVVPARELRAAQDRIRELERALGRKTMEVDILRAARDEVKKRPRWYGVSKR